MEIADVVRKLVGPIVPVGETRTDDTRYENLQTMLRLVDTLLSDIDRVAHDATHDQYSVRRAGERAAKFFDDLGIEN